MLEETRIALKNYDWLMRNRSDVGLAWESDTLVYGDGGVDIEKITERGFTEATEHQDRKDLLAQVTALQPGSPEQIIADALWDVDLQCNAGACAWRKYRDTFSYAGSTVRALREHGMLPPGPHPQSSGPNLKRRPPMPRFANEADLAERVLTLLDQHFLIDTEVVGRHCSGRRLRIDAILRPRDPGPWKDDEPAFGVEFKLVHQKSFDTRDFSAWARQACDYTHVEWQGYGRLMVFACPSPIIDLGGTDAWLMAHLLGQFGVGELAPREQDGWAIMLHGDHVLWSERRGAAAAQRWSLRPKVGGGDRTRSLRRVTRGEPSN